MIKKLFLVLLFFLCFFFCKAQNIRIIVEDITVIADEKKISVFQVENEKDTLYLQSEKPEYYSIQRNDDIKLIIKYKNSVFELTDIRDITKCIYINYKSDAEKNCYVIQELYSDAIRTITISNLNNCSDITNIYFFREFDPIITKMDMKIRKEN